MTEFQTLVNAYGMVLENNSRKSSDKSDIKFKYIDIWDAKRIVASIPRRTDNKRYNPQQFRKYFKDHTVKWFGMFVKGKCMSLAVINRRPKSSTIDDMVMIAELQTIIKGYGKPLFEEILSRYPNIWWAVDPEGGESLREYYRQFRRLGMRELAMDETIWSNGKPQSFFWRAEDKRHRRLILRKLNEFRVKRHKAKPISFPEHEIPKLSKKKKGETFYTTRVSSDYFKFGNNDLLKLPWGKTGAVTGVWEIDSVEKHPFKDELTKSEIEQLSKYRRLKVLEITVVKGRRPMNESTVNEGVYDGNASIGVMDILTEFAEDKDRGVARKHWRRIDPTQYCNALNRLQQQGPELFTFSENVIDDWLEIIVGNTQSIDAIGILTGRNSLNGIGEIDYVAVRDVFPEEFERNLEQERSASQSMTERTLPNAAYATLGELGFYDWAVLPDGGVADSDNAITTVERILSPIESDSPLSDKLVAINRCLDVFHQRSDWASAFIEGGKVTLYNISNYGTPTSKYGISESMDEIEYTFIGGDGSDFDVPGCDYNELCNGAWELPRKNGNPINLVGDKEAWYVAHIGNEVVGAVYGSILGGVYDFDIIVDENYRRQGIFKKLMQLAMDDYHNGDYEEMGFKLGLNIVNDDIRPYIKTRME